MTGSTLVSPASAPAGRDARAVEGPLPPGILADIAAGMAAARPLWGAVVRHEPEERRPVRLLATERYEVWVIGWTTGQAVRLHDHGDSAGAVAVAAGELTEVLPCRSTPSRTVERRLRRGAVRDVPVGTVHDVVNRAPEAATSIHVYSPPITAMTYYDAATCLPVETVTVRPEDTVLAHRASSFLLHPANRR